MDVDDAGGAAIRAVALRSRREIRLAAHRSRRYRRPSGAIRRGGEDRGDTGARMIPKSGNRLSDKIMRKQTCAMKVRIAGFGPFPGAPSNPSGHLAMALARRRRPALAGIEITSHVFATAYNAVDRDLPKPLARKPDVLLIFGLAGRRRHLCIETRARNARSILLPDVRGWRPERAIIEPGQSALIGNAPFPRLLHALRRTALPA